jgi:hypothetical protein
MYVPPLFNATICTGTSCLSDENADSDIAEC